MPRLKYPVLAPEGYAALSAFGHYVNSNTALESVLLGLVYLRASILNGCHFCIQLHQAELRKHHEPESRIKAVETAPESDAFTPREAAAMRWTAAVTRLDGREIPDEEYHLVTRFFRDKNLVDLTFAIANINAWNRMGVAFQPQWRPASGQAASMPNTEMAEQAPATAVPDEVRDAEGERGDGERASALDDDGGKVATD